MNNSYITIIKEKRTDWSRKRVPLNQNECTADFRISVPFGQNLLLGEKAFQFSPAEWLTIHRRLFEGVFTHAGQIRQYNITKKEWVLKGDTVTYAAWNSIKDTLDYDFATEKQYSYEGLSVERCVKHLAKFASDIWQIHPFCEGNTRATAVFIIKYMKTFGFKVNNDAFEKNSWYFRNALVRANYNDLQNSVHATTKFLEMFFSNLILGTEYELKNGEFQEGVFRYCVRKIELKAP